MFLLIVFSAKAQIMETPRKHRYQTVLEQQ